MELRGADVSNRLNDLNGWNDLNSTLGSRLVSVINCNTRHAGQIEYLRGLVKYGGWFPVAES